VQAICCQECDDPHDAKVAFDGGRYGVMCPDLGFVPVAREEIAAVVPELSQIVTALADAFGTKRRKTTPLHGETWRIGATTSQGYDVVLYFHPCLTSEHDVFALRAALSRESRSPFRLVLTARGVLPVPEAQVALLTDVIEFEASTGTLIPTSAPSVIVGAPIKRVGGAPNIYGDTLRQLIQSRIEGRAALRGRNEEAKAIESELRKRDPNAKVPSLPTIKRYLSQARGGS